MEHVSSRPHRHAEPEVSDRKGRGALGWTAFLVICMVAAAAIIAGAIRAKLSSANGPAVQPALSSAPSPAPAPLPRPGPARPGAMLAGL